LMPLSSQANVPTEWPWSPICFHTPNGDAMVAVLLDL
jgi:hypothetical protein